MLKTSMRKLVELNYKNMQTNPKLNLKDFYNEFWEKSVESFVKAEKQIILDVAKQENLSYKCAEYYTNKYFNFKIHLEEPTGLFGEPKFYLVLEPKSVEELLENVDETDLDLTDCDKELLDQSYEKMGNNNE